MNTLTITRPNQEIPVLVYTTRDKLPQAFREVTYQVALKLVKRIDTDLSRGDCYYRTRAGNLLTTLDEVIRAIIADDLVIGEASKVGELTAEDYRRIMRVVYREHTRRFRERRRKEKLQLAAASNPAA